MVSDWKVVKLGCLISSSLGVVTGLKDCLVKLQALADFVTIEFCELLLFVTYFANSRLCSSDFVTIWSLSHGSHKIREGLYNWHPWSCITAFFVAPNSVSILHLSAKSALPPAALWTLLLFTGIFLELHFIGQVWWEQCSNARIMWQPEDSLMQQNNFHIIATASQ